MDDKLLESMNIAVSEEAGYISEELSDDADVNVDDIISIQSTLIS